LPPPPTSTLFPYTTLFRSHALVHDLRGRPIRRAALSRRVAADDALLGPAARHLRVLVLEDRVPGRARRLPRRAARRDRGGGRARDRKSTRLNSSHLGISYA